MESTTNMTIEAVMRWLKSGKLVLDPPYQRGLVWSQSMKSGFIDSIRRRYPIPCVFFLVREENSMECFDGKNRLNAIREFIDNQWPHKLEDSGKTEFFADLSQKEKDDFIEHPIVVRKMIGPDWTDATVRDFFRRIQNSASLSYDEGVNSLDTPLVNIAKEIARRLMTSTIQKLPLSNRNRHKYLGTIINIIAFHDSVNGPLGGLDVLPDKQHTMTAYAERHTPHQAEAMSVDVLAQFVKDVMDLCASVHAAPRCSHAWALMGTKICRQVSLLGFKTAARFVAEEGSTRDAFARFHDAFHYIVTQRARDDDADENVRVYLSGRDDRDQYGLTVFNKKYAAFQRILARFSKT